MSYLYNNVEELRQNLSPEIDIKEINPAIAQNEFWDFGNPDEIKEIMETLTVARVRTINSPYYVDLFNHHNIDQEKIEDVSEIPFTRKEDSKFGPGIKDAERRQTFSLQDTVSEYTFVGANTGSTGDIRIQLPNTKTDLLFEHNRMASIFKQIMPERIRALNLYNPVTLGADTFQGALQLLEGVNHYPQPGYELDDIVNLIESGNVNTILGVSRAPGDETGRKGPTRVEDIVLDRLVPSGYLDNFDGDNPLLTYVVGSAVSERLKKQSKSIDGLVVAGAYGLQEARPLASAFNGSFCREGNMHLTQFPYHVQIVDVDREEHETLTDYKGNRVTHRGQVMISTPLKQGAPLINYLTEDGATLDYCNCSRTSPIIYNIDRLSGEVLTMLGCRA